MCEAWYLSFFTGGALLVELFMLNLDPPFCVRLTSGEPSEVNLFYTTPQGFLRLSAQRRGQEVGLQNIPHSPLGASAVP